MTMNELLKGFLLEVLRVCLAAIIPVLLAYVNVLPPLYVPIATAILRAADRAVVSWQKARAKADNRELTGYTGLTGF